MDLETVKRIWALNSAYGSSDHMARSAVSGQDGELLEMLLEHVGPQAFYNHSVAKMATDAVSTAAALGRMTELRWLLDRGLPTYLAPETYPANAFTCPAIERASRNGQIEAVVLLYEKFDLFEEGRTLALKDTTVLDGVKHPDVLTVLIGTLGETAKRGGDVERGAALITELLEQGKLKVDKRRATYALNLGLHELLIPLIKAGANVALDRWSGSKGVDNERMERCWRTLLQAYDELKMTSAGGLFCVTNQNYGQALGGTPLDKRTLPTHHHHVVNMFRLFMERGKADASKSSEARAGRDAEYARAARALVELWQRVLPEALDGDVAAQAASQADAQTLDALLSMGVDVSEKVRLSHSSASKGYIHELVRDPDVARVLHAHGVDLNKVWWDRTCAGDLREHSILTEALIGGKDDRVPLIQALYDLGVDFTQKVNGRTVAQHAAKASDGVKRTLAACKTGRRIEAAFSGGAPDAGADPDDKPSSLGGSGMVL